MINLLNKSCSDQIEELIKKCMRQSKCLKSLVNHAKMHHCYLLNLMRDNYQIYATARFIDISLDDTSLDMIDQAISLSDELDEVNPNRRLEVLQKKLIEADELINKLTKLSENLLDVIKADKACKNSNSTTEQF